MKFIALTGCLLLASLLYAQTPALRYEHTNKYTRTHGCEVIGNHVFYSKSHNTDFTLYSDTAHWLIKADAQLSRLDSIELRSLFNLPSQKSLIMLDMKVDKGELEMSLLSRDTGFYCGFTRSHILRFDTNLNLLDSITLGSANHAFSVANTFDLNNKRLAAGYSHQCVNGNFQNSKQGIADLSLPNSYQSIDLLNNGNPINFFNKVNDTTFVYSANVYNVSSSWVILNENWEMTDNGFLGGSSLMPGNGGQFLVFDYISRPNQLPVPISVGYSYYSGGKYWNLTVGDIDTLNNTSQSDTLPIGGNSLSLFSGTYFRIVPSQDMTDHRNLDSVFFAQVPEAMAQADFENKVIKPMYFYSYNATAMQTNAVRKLIPDYPWDHNFAVSSFSDGRILLGVNEYNWDKFGNKTMAIRWMVFPRDGSLAQPFYHKAALSLNAFPNPSSEHLKLSGIPSGWKQIKYQITDLEGRQLSKGELSPSALQLNLKALGLKAGIYFLQIENGVGEKAKPIKVVFD